MPQDPERPHEAPDRRSVARSAEPATGEVRSIDRAVAVLDAFTGRRAALNLSDVAEAVGLGTSTTHRLLRSLTSHGLLRRDDDARTYRLGPHVLRLAQAAVGAMDLREVSRPVLWRLRDAADETVGLHLLRGERHRVVADQVESHQPLRRTYTELGEPIPLHHGAPGKVLLALMPDERRAAYLAGGLAAANERTIVDPHALAAELVAIRRDGHAFSFGERVDGIHTVAAAVRDHSGAAVASLSVTGPALRMPRERLADLAPLVRAAATELSALLGYRIAPGVP